MKKNKPNYYKESLDVLLELKQLYPSYSLGKHIATALDEYGDIWGLTDKEVSYALTKYKAQMQMDVPHETGDKELKKIIEDGLNLSNLFKGGEEEDEENHY